jgi:hypothetical protein
MFSVVTTYPMLLGHVPHKTHHLETRSGIESARWLVKEQDLGTCCQLTGYADPSLLPA